MTRANTAAPDAVGLHMSFDIAVVLRLIGGHPEEIHAKINLVNSGLVELSSPVYLPPNQKLQVECDGRTIKSCVAYCRRQPTGTYAVAIRMGPDSYIRAEVRIPVDLTTSLILLGSPTSVPVRVLDLSPSGLGIEVTMPIPIGARVSVSLGHWTVLGEIRHCAPNQHKHRAGIRLEKVVVRKAANARVWSDLNGGSGNAAALAAFARAVEEKQSKSTAILLSLTHSLPSDHSPH